MTLITAAEWEILSTEDKNQYEAGTFVIKLSTSKIRKIPDESECKIRKEICTEEETQREGSNISR